MISLNDIRLDELPEQLRALAACAQEQADISLAAAQLGMLHNDARTRPPRVYTGRIFGKRAWRGMQVILPNGRVGRLYRVMRGVAVVTFRDEFDLRPDQHVAVGTEELQPFRFPAAVILGRAKRGVRELPSSKKAQAARTNGAAPSRPGSRPRGRPRSNPATGPQWNERRSSSRALGNSKSRPTYADQCEDVLDAPWLRSP